MLFVINYFCPILYISRCLVYRVKRQWKQHGAPVRHWWTCQDIDKQWRHIPDPVIEDYISETRYSCHSGRGPRYADNKWKAKQVHRGAQITDMKQHTPLKVNIGKESKYWTTLRGHLYLPNANRSRFWVLWKLWIANRSVPDTGTLHFTCHVWAVYRNNLPNEQIWLIKCWIYICPPTSSTLKYSGYLMGLVNGI